MIEGDDPGAATAHIPFTVTGTLTGRAALAVGMVTQARRERRSFRQVELAPGQTSGTVPVDYEADRRDDRPVTVYLVGFPSVGVMTDDYIGGLSLRDDDPAPRFSVRAPRRVSEGRSATWTVALAHRVDYVVRVSFHAVAGGVRGPKLTVADVPSRWRSSYLPIRTPRTPLHRTGMAVSKERRPGLTLIRFTVPTRRDSAREGREAVSLLARVHFAERSPSRTKTVYVVD